MHRTKKSLPSLALAAIAGASLLACAPELITPQQAQDKVYDHLSRAEAHRLNGAPQLVRRERETARSYKRLIEEGKTTTPEQALAVAAWHRQRAEAYQMKGYTRFVPAELKQAVRYEDFAVRAGGVPAAQAKADEYREKASRYDRMGLERFAEHYRRQGEKLQSAALVRIATFPGDR